MLQAESIRTYELKSGTGLSATLTDGLRVHAEDRKPSGQDEAVLSWEEPDGLAILARALRSQAFSPVEAFVITRKTETEEAKLQKYPELEGIDFASIIEGLNRPNLVRLNSQEQSIVWQDDEEDEYPALYVATERWEEAQLLALQLGATTVAEAVPNIIELIRS